MTTQYTIPFDMEREREVLGSALFNPQLIDILCYEVLPTDFHWPANIKIFTSIKDFNDENVQATQDILFKHFSAKDTGVVNSLLDMHNQYFSAEMLQFSIKRLKEVTIKRSLFRASERGLTLFNGPSELDHEAVETWSDGIRNITYGAQNHKYRLLKDVYAQPDESKDQTILQAIQQRQEMYRTGQEVFTGHKTHYIDLDVLFDGFNAGHLTLIGARPGVGKTTFMLNLALRQMLQNKLPVGIFSLEMTTEQLSERLLYAHAGIDWKEARKGKLTSDEYQSLVVASHELEEVPMLLDDKGRSDLSLIMARANHWKDRYGVKIIFIDYVQLIKGSGKFNNKYEEITDISQKLKVMAKELDVPVVALAQLNRGLEQKADKIPQSSDLRDSGALEQDADEIFLLHSPSHYDKTDKPGILQVFLKKNRFGPTGKVDLQVDAAKGQINNLAKLEKPYANFYDQDR